MTRRLVVLMVGLVVTTCCIAGLGTLVLANVRARHDDRGVAARSRRSMCRATSASCSSTELGPT